MESVKTAEHYVVLEGTTLEDLIYRVRTWKREGWIPQGGIALHSLRLGYCQAMVKPPTIPSLGSVDINVHTTPPVVVHFEEEE